MISRSTLSFYPVKFIVACFLLFSFIGCQNTENFKKEDNSQKEEKNIERLEELYWKQVKQSRMSSFTDADVHFMTGMIAHHAQALIMSRLAPQNDASSQIQTLAARIINAQKDEIVSMQQWLRDRDQAVPKIQIDGLQLTIMLDGKPFTRYKKMAGVLSQTQLEELHRAQGLDFDRLFLKYMIEHHSGAVGMVQKLFNTDGAAQDEEAFRLASDIQVDQKTEIERMNLMLNELTASGNPS